MSTTPRIARGRKRLLACGVTALASLFLLSGAQSGVNTPGSGWYAGNPLLGPSNLTHLAAANGTAYAAGNDGTLLKSTDNGATWTGLVTGVQSNLTIVRIVGDDPASVVVGSPTSLLRSDNGGQTFVRLPFSRGGAQLSTVTFPSKQVGYLLLSNGSVLSTADGGRTFSRKTAVPGGAPSDIAAISDTTAFVVTRGGVIQRTTDGAASWTQVHAGSPPLSGIDRADASTFYAVGNGMTLLKSVDGGKSWNAKPITSVPPGDLSSISTADANTALIATESGSQVLRTEDGGDTFTSIVPSSDPTLAATFVAGTKAISVGSYGSAQTSADAGATWKTVGSRIVGSFRLVHAVSGLVAYAGGDEGVLARTVDRGQTWTNISPPTSARIISIAAPTVDTLFVLAADGTLQRSDNGGASYRILDMGTRTLPGAVVALDSTRILLIGPRGIRRSTNGGGEFLPVVNRIARTAVVSSGERVGGTVYAYGTRTLIVSRDGGATWKPVKLPNKRSIRDVAFGTAARGLLLDTRGELWQTRNGGKSWAELECLGAWHLTGVDFSDATHAFVLAPSGPRGAGGYLLRTNNGGTTWAPQFVSRGTATALEAAGSTSYLLVGNSILYATTTGGDVGVARKLTLTTKPRVLPKRGTITLRGRLSPAVGGEEIIVSRYMGDRWAVKRTTIASNGRFSMRWPVTGTAIFVAQAFADADHAAAATPALTVKLVPPKPANR